MHSEYSDTNNESMRNNMKLKYFYLVACIIGTVVPWMFFVSFFVTNGVDIPAFLAGLFANGAAAGFSADVIMSIGVFWVWAYTDAKKNNVPKSWVILPAGCFVGLSLALPLYLYLRCEAPNKTSNNP